MSATRHSCRSKEIAIRKVNGAEASSILRLLSAGILKVAVGAVLIGIAFSWYVSGIWMEQFPDGTLLSPGWFIGVGVALLVLIVLVVVVKAWRLPMRTGQQYQERIKEKYLWFF